MAETIEKQLDGLAKTCDSLRPGTGSTIRLLCQAFYEKGLSSRGDAGTPQLDHICRKAAEKIAKLQHMGIERGLTLREDKIWEILQRSFSEAALAHREAPPLQKIIDVIENEPLGYRTEDEHAKLENFADRCIAKILQLPVAHREPPQDTQRLTEMQVALGKLKDAESAWQAERKQLRKDLTHATSCMNRSCKRCNALASGPQPIPEASLRMQQFVESVIQEVEEAGIDDEHAADE